MLKRFKNQFSDEAKSQREQQRQERKAEQERERQEREAQVQERKAAQERELQLAAEAEAEELRQKVAFRNTILHILGEGKVPDLGLDVDVPFKLQRGERWLLATDDVPYAEMRVKREIQGRSAGTSVRVMKGVSVRAGASRGTPVETDVLTSRGSGLFAVSTKHIFFHGDRSFRIPHGKIVSAQAVASTGLEIVRDRASALPEYFGIGDDDSEFVAELIHLLPEVDFGKGDPQLQTIEHYILAGHDIGADDMLDQD